MAASAGQPGTQIVAVFLADVTGRQAMIIWLQCFAKIGGIGQDIAACPRQKYVLAFFFLSLCSAVADHNFAIEWFFALPWIAQSL